MNFSLPQFLACTAFQIALFGSAFMFMGLFSSFLFSMIFFSLNALGWVFLVRMLINASVNEGMSPVVVMLCVGKVVILFCFLWLLLERVSTMVVVTSNILVAFSLAVACISHIPKLEFSNGE